MESNKNIMQEARSALIGHWRVSVGASALSLLPNILIGGEGEPSKEDISSTFFTVIANIVFYGVLKYGFDQFWLSIARQGSVSIQHIFQGFSDFKKLSITGAWQILFILLWALLLIVPGIMAALSYSMTFFILNDDTTLAPKGAIEKSKQMMYGYKWQLFCLILRFIGWFLLSLMTLGIGFLWFIPYISVSSAKFYDQIKDHPTIN